MCHDIAADCSRVRERQEVLHPRGWGVAAGRDLADSRIHVLERTASVAQRGYDISLERFKNGLITRNDLAFAQQRLTTAKMNRLSALVDYQLGTADLKRRTLWDFERNSPVAPIMGGEEE